MNHTIGKIEQLTNTPPTVGAVRRVVKVSRNETFEQKMRRLVVAQIRMYAQECPDDAKALFRELVDTGVVK